MSRRCKVGKRAKYVNGRNTGRIVLIDRPYYGELVDDSYWPEAVVFPWVVVSLGGPLQAIRLDTGLPAPLSMNGVCEDQDLEPLDDDDDGLTTNKAAERSPPKAVSSGPKQATPVFEAAP